jgi:hypothetical protein
MHSEEPLSPRFVDGNHERPIVPRGDNVDRGAEHGPLNDHSLLQGLCYRLSLEARHSRPQADVDGRGVLSLQTAHPFQDPGKGCGRSLEQHLPGQHRSIELPGSEDGHQGCDPGGEVPALVANR